MRLFRLFCKLSIIVALTVSVACSGGDQQADDQVDSDDQEDPASQEDGEDTAQQEDEIDPAAELADEGADLPGEGGGLESLSDLTSAIEETEAAAEIPAEPEPAEVPAEASAPAPAVRANFYVGYNVGNILFVKNHSAQIYSTPDAAGVPAGTLADRDRVTVQGRQGTFIKIGEGQWVAFRDVSADLRLANSGTHVVTAYKLNIRNRPGMNGRVLGQLPKGSRVRIMSTNGSWVKIGQGKFVHKSYLSNQLAH